MEEFKLEKLRNVVLQMKLPIAFDVLNSIGKDDNGEPYFVVINNIPSKILFSRIYDFKYKDEFNISPFSRMKEDRSGLLSYSLVQIWFDDKMINSARVDKNNITLFSEQFVDIALEYLNKFIHSYKSITNNYWLRQIIKMDIFNYQYILVDSDENTKRSWTMISQHHLIEINGGKEFKLEDDDDKLLRQLLVTDSFSIRNEIIFHMHDNYSLGYYNTALLQSVILFENYVYTNLKKTLSNTKLNKIKKKAECGCLVGINEICTRGLKEYYNYDFESKKEWKDLLDNTLKFRNKIVHGELLESILKPQCELAINSVKKAEEILEKEVFK